MVTDPATYVKNLLDTNWNALDIAKPTIGLIYDYKRIDLRNSDFVLIYRISSTSKPQDIGNQTKQVIDRIAIDIRTETKANLLLLKAEVVKIIENNLATDATFNLMIPDDTEWIDLSNKLKKLWRITGEIKLYRFGKTRGELI